MLYTEADFPVRRDGRKKDKQMATELARIAELSAQNPTMVFTSIAHLINVKLLRECHEKMDADKAVGIDGVTKEEYGKNLEENLVDLVDRMKKKSYKPKPARRVEIPKDNGKTRPLRNGVRPCALKGASHSGLETPTRKAFSMSPEL